MRAQVNITHCNFVFTGDTRTNSVQGALWEGEKEEEKVLAVVLVAEKPSVVAAVDVDEWCKGDVDCVGEEVITPTADDGSRGSKVMDKNRADKPDWEYTPDSGSARTLVIG